MPQRPPKTTIIPVDDKHVLEIQTEFTISVGQETAEKIQRVLDAPDGTRFSQLAEMVGMSKYTDFTFGNFDGIDLRGEGDYWQNANFRGSSFKGSKFGPDVSLKSTLLEGADLTDAEGLTAEMLAETYIDETTILPDYIDRSEVNALHEALNMPPAPMRVEEDRVITIQVPATLHRRQ